MKQLTVFDITQQPIEATRAVITEFHKERAQNEGLEY